MMLLFRVVFVVLLPIVCLCTVLRCWSSCVHCLDSCVVLACPRVLMSRMFVRYVIDVVLYS